MRSTGIVQSLTSNNRDPPLTTLYHFRQLLCKVVIEFLIQPMFGRVGPVNDIFEVDILRINALSSQPPHKRARRLVKVG